MNKEPGRLQILNEIFESRLEDLTDEQKEHILFSKLMNEFQEYTDEQLKEFYKKGDFTIKTLI